MRSWQGVIYGQACSKANSRRQVLFRIKGTNKFRPASIKSEEARAYEKSVQRQVPILTPLLGGRLRIIARIYYTWEGPDLDESLILDALQGRIYLNDRQVREKHLIHAIDKANPRAIIRIEEVTPLGLEAAGALQLPAPGKAAA